MFSRKPINKGSGGAGASDSSSPTVNTQTTITPITALASNINASSMISSSSGSGGTSTNFTLPSLGSASGGNRPPSAPTADSRQLPASFSSFSGSAASGSGNTASGLASSFTNLSLMNSGSSPRDILNSVKAILDDEKNSSKPNYLPFGTSDATTAAAPHIAHAHSFTINTAGHAVGGNRAALLTPLGGPPSGSTGSFELPMGRPPRKQFDFKAVLSHTDPSGSRDNVSTSSSCSETPIITPSGSGGKSKILNLPIYSGFAQQQSLSSSSPIGLPKQSSFQASATPDGLSSPISSSSSSSSPKSLRLQAADSNKYKEIMKNAGYLNINGSLIKTSMLDLAPLAELGSGTCGHVIKMKHVPSGYVMAVKQMSITGIIEENKRIIMDLSVFIKSHECDDIVRCLGYFISDSEVWICMELMTMCFDKLLKLTKKGMPEDIMGKLAVSTLNSLNFLKEQHNVIHRDIKPSNILIDESGSIKLCDFGISGTLVNSKVQSRNSTGCAGYMAPERIDYDPANPNYDIRADVWSLGITLVELATGEYPYKGCRTEFEAMTTILTSPAPKLEGDRFSPQFKHFIEQCLVKDVKKRPKYNILLQHPFVLHYKKTSVDVRSWFGQLLVEHSYFSSREKKNEATNEDDNNDDSNNTTQNLDDNNTETVSNSSSN